MKKSFEHILTYKEVLSVIEEATGEIVKGTKVLNKGKGPFVLWVFEDGSFVSTPCGASVKEGDRAKTLTFGFNENMDTVVGFRQNNISDDEIQEYCFDSKLPFGMHKGVTLQRLIDKDGWSYLEWCVLNIASFSLSEAVYMAYVEDGPNKESVIEMLNTKHEALHGDEDYEDEDYEDAYPANSSDSYDYKRASFEALTDGEDFDYDDFDHHGGDFGMLMELLGH